MDTKVQKGSLKVSKILFDFLEIEVLDKLGLDKDKFWQNFEDLIYKFTPLNQKLLEKRNHFKKLIDEFYLKNKNNKVEISDYISFLKEINYIIPEGPDFKIETENVDDEIATIAGSQLVVPVTNARYSINAANARWGSLYDAIYGSDLIREDKGLEKGSSYNAKRGQEVIEFGRNFLDKYFPLLGGSHHDVKKYGRHKERLIDLEWYSIHEN